MFGELVFTCKKDFYVFLELFEGELSRNRLGRILSFRCMSCEFINLWYCKLTYSTVFYIFQSNGVFPSVVMDSYDILNLCFFIPRVFFRFFKNFLNKMFTNRTHLQ